MYMEQTLQQTKENTGFGEYLNSTKDNMFVLDLSKCSLLECIEKMCEIKVRAHPNIRKNYKLLVAKIKEIEKQYNCTVMPAMISYVFWDYFIPFLAEQGMKYSTINLLKINVITVLNWASKYGVKLNPSFNEVHVPNYVPAKISLTPD